MYNTYTLASACVYGIHCARVVYATHMVCHMITKCERKNNGIKTKASPKFSWVVTDKTKPLAPHSINTCYSLHSLFMHHSRSYLNSLLTNLNIYPSCSFANAGFGCISECGSDGDDGCWVDIAWKTDDICLHVE